MINLRSRKAAAMVVVVDFLLAVLLMQQAILSLTTISRASTPPRIETLGYYLIKITWPESTPDDVDLYVQDPLNNTVYYSNPQSGLMHLERDDLGKANDKGLHGVVNQERVILRGTEIGEYIVNVHMYYQYSDAPYVPVHIEIWRLRGDDKKVFSKDVSLRGTGDQITVTRFTLDSAQMIGRFNNLWREIVTGAYNQVGGQGPGGIG